MADNEILQSTAVDAANEYDASEIQVLDPSNYSTVDLRVPEGVEIGDSVRVVSIDDVLYMVP